MATLASVCDALVVRPCSCLVGKHWFVLIAAASYTTRMLKTTACCAVEAVHDLVEAGHTFLTPADVLKILCANYVKQQMRRLFLRRDRSRSPRVCERVCERLGLSREHSPVTPETKQEEAPNDVEEAAVPDNTTPDFIPLETTPEFIPLDKPESSSDTSEDLEDEEDPATASRGVQILALMSRVVRFFSADEPDDGAQWLESAQEFPELQDMVTAYHKWRTARNALRDMAEEGPVRDFEVAVAALMSFIDVSMHEDEDDEEEDDEDDEEDDDDPEELCCDTSSDDDEADSSCEQDPCFAFLHSVGANVTRARFKHLERFRTAFAGKPDATLREICMAMLQNLECVCLDEEPSLLHTWVDATVHAIVSAGSDKCEVIVATRAFFTLERRWPTLAELQEYAGRQRMQSGDPDRFYREERFAVPTPHLDRLVSTPAQQQSDCAICGHLVEVGANCFLLACGHQFHAVDCLGEDSIRTWLNMNRRCPVCRVEVAL
jgi:hypothetical protein